MDFGAPLFTTISIAWGNWMLIMAHNIIGYLCLFAQKEVTNNFCRYIHKITRNIILYLVLPFCKAKGGTTNIFSFYIVIMLENWTKYFLSLCLALFRWYLKNSLVLTFPFIIYNCIIVLFIFKFLQIYLCLQ